jgi:hypothetical protein
MVAGSIRAIWSPSLEPVARSRACGSDAAGVDHGMLPPPPITKPCWSIALDRPSRNQFRGVTDAQVAAGAGEHGKVWEAVLSAMGGIGLGDAALSQNYLWEALSYRQQTSSILPPPTLCHAPTANRCNSLPSHLHAKESPAASDRAGLSSGRNRNEMMRRRRYSSKSLKIG